MQCTLQTDLQARITRALPRLAFLLDNSLTLKDVDLSWNRLGPDGCKLVAEALQFNQSVVRIDLGYNALGAAGGAYIGEVLYDNRCRPVKPITLGRLRGRTCLRIHRSVSCLILLRAACICTPLHRAPLAGPACVPREDMHVCRNLRYVGLAGNRLAVQSCIVLQSGMRMSRCLDTLALDANPLGPRGRRRHDRGACAQVRRLHHDAQL